MMLHKRWERYVFFELVKVFTFFLFAFYFVFSLMDYATHMKDFASEGKITLWPLISYTTGASLSREQTSCYLLLC
jgi:lipopolysaccharide export LptBFGC system permease protein LptF